MNIICLDTETTGLDRSKDEILQLAIVDGFGLPVFNEYFKPIHRQRWSKAEDINHISPAMVKNCKPLLHYGFVIESILKEADVIVGYNLHSFHLPFLFNSGISKKCLKETCIIIDVMLSFSKIYREYDSDVYGDGYQTLGTCASFYHYPSQVKNDALCDSKAVLYCFYKIFGNPPIIPERGAGIFPASRRAASATRQSRQQSPVVPPPVPAAPATPKSGRVMMGFGVLFLLTFDPIGIIAGALLLYFGCRRYKVYKDFKNSH